MLGHLRDFFWKFRNFLGFSSTQKLANMRFLEGNPVTGSFSRKFRVQQAKKAKTKSIYTPPLGEKKEQVCVSPKKYFWQGREGTETCYFCSFKNAWNAFKQRSRNAIKSFLDRVYRRSRNAFKRFLGTFVERVCAITSTVHDLFVLVLHSAFRL